MPCRLSVAWCRGCRRGLGTRPTGTRVSQVTPLCVAQYSNVKGLLMTHLLMPLLRCLARTVPTLGLSWDVSLHGQQQAKQPHHLGREGQRGGPPGRSGECQIGSVPCSGLKPKVLNNRNTISRIGLVYLIGYITSVPRSPTSNSCGGPRFMRT